MKIRNLMSFNIHWFLVFLGFISVGWVVASDDAAESAPTFLYEVVDRTGPRAPWGKTVGDIDGDGWIDLVVGGHQPRELGLFEKVLRKLGYYDADYPGGALIWYQNPTWKPHLVSEDFLIRTDLDTADINCDGRLDIVVLAEAGIYWLANPDWEKNFVGYGEFHDVEVSDLDRDGHIDIVARKQTLFGGRNGDWVFLFRNEGDAGWMELTLPVPHGEGLKVNDIDGDGFDDIVVNRYWLQNPGGAVFETDWVSEFYSQDWQWDDVFIDTGDFDRDGREDIVLAPAEEVGERYQIAWFEAPAERGRAWHKHVIDPDVEAVHHFVSARDANLDGNLDVFTAEMTQSKDPDNVTLYLNLEGQWQKQILAGTGSHSMRAVDLDLDFDIDLFGANWQLNGYPGSYPVELWRNTVADPDGWIRHVVDSERPGQANFVFTGDLDGDGLPDIVSGGFWYRQPSFPNESWQRFEVGESARDVAMVADFDGDGDLDMLASSWQGSKTNLPTLTDRILNRLGLREHEYDEMGNMFVWAQNDGRGRFTVRNNIEPASGDFLQGSARLQTSERSRTKILLSFHRGGEGVQAIEVPEDPVNEIWKWSRLSADAQDEAIDVGDIDGDGFPDVLLGSLWLHSNANGNWQTRRLVATELAPDRSRLADIDGDGRLDAVIGYEAISEFGKLAWYRQPALISDSWSEQLVAEITGPMSLGIADMDGDNDLDIVAGEHNLVEPSLARLILFENLDRAGRRWRPHLIYRGDEHHNGALVTDLDLDGDFDVVSIGWSHGKVIFYENAGNNRAKKR